MRTQKIGMVLAIFLLSSILVSADFNILLEQGGSPQNKYAMFGVGQEEPYSFITTVGSTTGSFTTPLVFDANLDGTMDVFVYGGNNIINVLNGDNILVEQASLVIGEPFISPAACDIDNDGRLEYVGVFNNGTDVLTYIDVTPEGNIVQGPFIILDNQTNIFGKIACSRFFQSEGDLRSFVMFVDVNKFLHFATVSGGVWEHTIIDSDGSVDHESSGLDYTFGDNDMVIMDNPGTGAPVAIWVSGEFLHGFSPDLTGWSEDFSSETTLDPTQYNRIQYGVRTSPFGSDKLVVVNSAVDNDNSGDHNILLFKVTSFGDSNQWALDATQTINFGGSGTRNSHMSMMLGSYDNTDGTEDVILREELEQKQSGTGGVGVRVLSGNDLSILNDTNSIFQCDSAADRLFPNRAFYMNMEAGGSRDIVTSCRNISNSLDYIYALRGDDFNTLQEINAQDFTVGGLTPYPVDYNLDGAMDFIYTSPARTFFLQSTVESPTQRNFPFNVGVNQSIGLDVFTDINVEFASNFFYKYTAVCSIQSETIWAESFTANYNFTERNVSLFANKNLDPQDFIGAGGFNLEVTDTNITRFSLVKEHPVGVRDTMAQLVSWATPGDSSIVIFTAAADGFFTSIWQVNRTGQNITVTKLLPGIGSDNLGTVTIEGDLIRFRADYFPRQDQFNNSLSYDVTITVNAQVVNETAGTLGFIGDNIKDMTIEVTQNGNYSIAQMALKQQTDVEPPFVLFQNGIETTENIFTISVPSPQLPFVQGQGFRVIPGFNRTFVTQCSYEEPGTYLQRHYISPPTALEDYTNFREILVGTDVEAVFDEVDGGFEGDEFFDDLISDLPEELQGPFGRFLIWLGFAFIIVIIGFSVNPMLGIFSIPLAILIGVLSTALPIWIAVLLAILVAGLIALVFRKVFAGGG